MVQKDKSLLYLLTNFLKLLLHAVCIELIQTHLQSGTHRHIFFRTRYLSEHHEA